MKGRLVSAGSRLGAPWTLAATAAGAILAAGCGKGTDQVDAVRAQRPALTVSSASDWSFYRYDLLGQSYVDQPLTSDQARGFTTAWTFHGAGSDANPIVVGSTVYITESNGYLVAVDVATGQLRWSQPIGTTPPTSCSPYTGRPVGAAAVVGGTVFVPGGDGRVYAFDKDTGQKLWSTSVANVANNDFLWTSAFPLNGKIYVGIAALYENICGPVPGRVVALDQASGQVVATWWVNPQHAVGGGVWTGPAYDAASNRIFFTTGQGQTGVDLSTQPYSQAIVALDGDTLQPVDAFQPAMSPFADDYDFGASPTLFDLADGQHLIAAANKNGYVYALDRDHLSQGVVWAYQVSVPGDSPDSGTSTIVSASYAHGSLFVGGGQTPDGFAGAVAALDPATGAVRWMFHPDGFVLAALTTIGDVVVAEATHLPDRTGRLYVLDQATGAPLFQLNTPGPLFAQPSFAAGRLFVSDASGIVYALQPPPPSGTAAINFAGGFTSTAGLQLNGSTALSGSRLRLTNGGFHEAASAFFTTPVNVQSFTTDFSFQLTSANADGFTFTLQNIGPVALGPSGGGLGYGPDSPTGAPGIGKSVAVKFDLYNNAGEGTNSTGLYTNGASPTVPSVNLSGVNLHSGDVFNVHMTYDGTNLAMTIADASTTATTSVTFPIDIPATVGSTTAYAGFTAGTGGLSATQDILSWTFSPSGSSSQAATPSFSPAPGTYSSTQSVTLSDATPGATIYYTTDGTTPTANSTPYAGPITVSATATIKAIATASGFSNSAVASGTYTIQAQSTPVDIIVGMTSALSTVAQRHIVRVQPPNHAPVFLMAVQNDGYSNQHSGLLWYRSDDGGTTWSYYKDIIAQPDPAVYNTSRQPQTLHLTTDLIVVGSDVAAVYSYDTTSTGFPADAWDTNRVVYFQWWRFDGTNDWNARPRLIVASPGSGQAYHRAEVARDTLGRLWVQAFLRQSDCTNVGSVSCTGDLLQVWVSSDGGSTFQGPQNLATLTNQVGGGRLISVGSKLLMLWGDRVNPAQLMRRNDSDPVTNWSAQANAFSDGAHIYHGASLSAVADGTGGLHLVYKEWVSSPDNQQLYYRHFDGFTFGPATAVDSLGDWAMQPAITKSGSDLTICVNHMISTNANYEIRSYQLSAGFATWNTIDTQVQPKAYPDAPEEVGASDGTIPCAYGMGDTSVGGPGHTVQVAQQPIPQ